MYKQSKKFRSTRLQKQ